MTDSEAVSLLLNRFPQLPRLLNEELSPDESYYAYERLASEIGARRSDPAFFEAACKFIDELAASGDPRLRDILIATLLEKVAEDPALASKVKQCIGEPARDMLQAVERDLFGRKT